MAGEKKAKKPMTEEQLERLALARKKANEMRKINQAKRLQNKMDKIDYTSQKLLLKQLNALNDDDYKLIKPIEKLQKERSENYKRKRSRHRKSVSI